jgi:hypothetical protein
MRLLAQARNDENGKIGVALLHLVVERESRDGDFDARNDEGNFLRDARE